MSDLLTPAGRTDARPPLPEPSQDALFLDLDGTLAAIESRPQDVAPDLHRNRLLARLQARFDGRLAVVSGRAIEDVDRILEACVPAVAGVHGLIRRAADGTRTATPPHPGLNQVRDTFGAFAERDQRLQIEDKGVSVALHYRNAPGHGPAAIALARELAAQTGLVEQRGSAVVELRTPGPDKGQAVAAFLQQAPFAGHRPVFVGDDLTDEDAFILVERVGGMGVLVGPPRATAASYRLADVAAVLDWLEEALRA